MYQMVSLLQCGDGAVASKVLRKRRVKDLVLQVEALYLPWKDCSSALSAKAAASGASVAAAAAAGVGGAAAAVGSVALPSVEVGAGVGDVGAPAAGGDSEPPPSPSCE